MTSSVYKMPKKPQGIPRQLSQAPPDPTFAPGAVQFSRPADVPMTPAAPTPTATPQAAQPSPFASAIGAGGASGFGQYQPTGPQPDITAGPVYSPEQIEGQVTRSVGQNSVAAESGYKQALEELAGRGFSGNSPQSLALKRQYDNQAMLANQNARDIPFKLAKENASHLLSSQQAREAQYTSRQTEKLSKMKDDTAKMGQLFGLLGGMFNMG